MGTNYNTSIVRDGLVLYVDAANPKSYSPNVQPNSTDLFAWVTGTNGNCTIARDYTTERSPANGIPVKMSITGNDPYMATYNGSAYNLAPASSGQTWTASVWVKSSVATTGEIYLFGATAAGTVFYLDGVSQTDYSAGSITITPTWTRVSYSFTFSNALVARVQCRLDGTNASGTGIDIWWDGLQIELGSTVKPFNPIVNTNRLVWKDLTGGTDCAFTSNTYTHNAAGYVTFDGSANNYAVDSNGTRTKFNTGSFSISTLIYPTALTSTDAPTYVRICEKTGYPNAYFLFYIGSDGSIGFGAADNSLPTQQFVQPTSTTGIISINNWYYCVAVFDRDAAVSKVYVNGTEVASAAIGSSFVSIDTTNDLRFTSSFAEMASRYSMFAVYNIALSAAQVKQNYEAYRKRYSL